MPDFRRINYTNGGFGDSVFHAYIPNGSPLPGSAGRFFSNLRENITTVVANVTVPLPFIGKEQSIKVGGMFLERNRTFAARVLGYVNPRPTPPPIR